MLKNHENRLPFSTCAVRITHSHLFAYRTVRSTETLGSLCQQLRPRSCDGGPNKKTCYRSCRKLEFRILRFGVVFADVCASCRNSVTGSHGFALRDREAGNSGRVTPLHRLSASPPFADPFSSVPSPAGGPIGSCTSPLSAWGGYCSPCRKFFAVIHDPASPLGRKYIRPRAWQWPVVVLVLTAAVSGYTKAMIS